ncbi:dynamin family protein [Thiomicrorhabdus lithotrophica]|uniref:Dynamin family protein n=1 Tax=Thiomicrorhabdus lithotrophica TaxID=2949997 RepID=A0ABY8CA26_9GAMM|nr:dynamin family protein [Thiomicrorhabdus lithotrophica]WEJ62779.1 dynamin family protein [Thiomicrorhabdus lithotrophica]
MTPKERYLKLQQHLTEENPVLLDIINTYKELDKIGYKTGLLKRDESYATQISWWPLISVLGTFSAGKSTFINGYTSKAVQSTGNQAVDDKFTVLCYGGNDEVTTLPGLALDSDPRFPFFGISKEIEKVKTGEGSRIDNYLQLKTTNSAALKGKIIIDSPGFDADSQRDSTLRITNHIIEMSDLVLVFFDARHPEPGAMRDTLEHLVATTINRKDSDKILYILNQIDTAAQEDNPEEVIGSWQRAISSQGLVGGNFYAIYNEESANDFNDSAKAERFKRKKDLDLARINSRIDKVSIERTYRIANAMETIIEDMHAHKIPLIEKAITSWRRKVIAADIAVFTALIIALFFVLKMFGMFNTPFLEWPVFQMMQDSIIYGAGYSAIAVLIIFVIHWFLRAKFSKWDSARIEKTNPQLANALRHNTRFWRGMFPKEPRGWSKRNRRKLSKIVTASKKAIQKLNDQFANPSGKQDGNSASLQTVNEQVIEEKAPVKEDINKEVAIKIETPESTIAESTEAKTVASEK